MSPVLPADSTLRVKDVIKEFHPGGRLAQHSFGEVRHCHSIYGNRSFLHIDTCGQTKI